MINKYINVSLMYAKYIVLTGTRNTLHTPLQQIKPLQSADTISVI